MALLEVRDVCFGYGKKSRRQAVLRGVTADFEAGTLYALVGKSGSGKSTLMSLLAALLTPDAGEIRFDGTMLSSMDPLRYRRSCAATVYQDFALFPLLNVTENILYPMELLHIPAQEQRRRVQELQKQVGLPPELMARYPAAISGGEQQRVAIARALAAGARVILADEPTGNLDSANSEQIVELLLRAAHEDGRCVIVVTHDPEVAARADRVLRLTDGTLAFDPSAFGQENAHAVSR